MSDKKSYFRRVLSDTALLLTLVPFAFTLIVFMYQVGRYIYYDIPLTYITISIGQLFTVWFGLFIVVGILGYILLDVLMNFLFKHRLLRLLLVNPLILSTAIGLLFFVIDEGVNALFWGLLIFGLILFGNIISPLTMRDKRPYIEKLEEMLDRRGPSLVDRKGTAWDKYSGPYALVVFMLILLLGVPFRVGNLIESYLGSRWVKSEATNEILVDANNEFYLIKTYDPVKKELLDGYKIIPVSLAPVSFIEHKTGMLHKSK